MRCRHILPRQGAAFTIPDSARVVELSRLPSSTLALSRLALEVHLHWLARWSVDLQDAQPSCPSLLLRRRVLARAVPSSCRCDPKPRPRAVPSRSGTPLMGLSKDRPSVVSAPVSTPGSLLSKESGSVGSKPSSSEHVPSLPFLTTSTVCATSALQVCCALLPTMGFAAFQAPRLVRFPVRPRRLSRSALPFGAFPSTTVGSHHRCRPRLVTRDVTATRFSALSVRHCWPHPLVVPVRLPLLPPHVLPPASGSPPAPQPTSGFDRDRVRCSPLPSPAPTSPLLPWALCSPSWVLR